MSKQSRLQKVERYLEAHPPLVWHNYSEQFFKSLKPFVSKEELKKLRSEGGWWGVKYVEGENDWIVEHAKEIMRELGYHI
jgi:hypothetical protein